MLAAKILADAVLRQGVKQCLAIPEFGVERRGAPVTAYARLSEKPILIRTRIYEPDALVVLDPTLYAADILKGLKAGGTVLTNCETDALERLKAKFPGRTFVDVPARRIAIELKLGSPSSPVVNTAMCGAAAAVFQLCDLEPLLLAVRDSVPAKTEANVEAARKAYSFAHERRHAPA